ncbi:GntR family transcriptional regulator [Neptunicoccus cionae]|uniref:GntR family transcriptional regulator n=1 Tax=Neptunicoccus cionae TaxID=2035344 RepID=UPI000C762EC6|nr:GntR family transcriptional regulator [Amylibacter cionae]PLS21555.1 GntR family transcriptional regulator [Amylibacter cionae]
MNHLAALKPLEDTTIRGRTVEQLRRLVVTGELAAGMRLTETELADALGISRGPLREAIRELVDIGLLVSKPYKGLFVREITRKDLEEIYSLRTMLERFAFQEAWEKRTPEALEDLKARNKKLIGSIEAATDPLGPIEAELHLHSWCYELSGHRLLLQSWNRLKPNLQFYFAMHQQAHERKGPKRRSHDLYIRLASGNDLGAMLDHLNDHMRQGLETTIGFIDCA